MPLIGGERHTQPYLHPLSKKEFAVTTSDSTQPPISHLQAAAAAFTALSVGPTPLTLDCDALTHADKDCALPPGRITLPKLRTWLLENRRAYAARDVVWRELILRARTGDPQWVIAAVGMALPALIRHARDLTAERRGDTADIDNEILTGFLEALHHVAPGKPGAYASLAYAGYRAGLNARTEQDAHIPVDDIGRAMSGSGLPQLPYGHPDLLIERAATLGVIDAEDVEPWIDVRLGHRSIHLIAERLGLPVDQLRMRLRRADDRIAEALTAGLLTGTVSPETAKDLAVRAAARTKIRTVKAATAPTRGGIAASQAA